MRKRDDAPAATQYEALRRMGAPELPEGYAYRIGELDGDGDRLVAIVALGRVRGSGGTLGGYSSTASHTVARQYVVWIVRILVPIGERRHIVWTCRWLAWRLRRDLRAAAREKRRAEGLRIDGPLR